MMFSAIDFEMKVEEVFNEEDYPCCCCCPVSVSSTVLICVHVPSSPAFHKVTSLSPLLTANICPVTLQLTLQTGASNVCSRVGFHSELFPFWVQIKTVRSSEQEATTFTLGRIDGAQETSRTQSLWESSFETGAEVSSAH